MTRRRSSYGAFQRVLIMVLGLTVGAATPVAARSDTTAPQLLSLSVSPARIDTSAGDQTITVVAEITDDLSGVCTDHSMCSVPSWVTIYSSTLDAPGAFADLRPLAGDTYAATITIPRGSQPGVWNGWSIQAMDGAENISGWGETELLRMGINLAVGVDSFESTYTRTFRALKLNPPQAPRIAFGSFGHIPGSPCTLDMPVVLQRKTRSGWKQIGNKYSHGAKFRFEWESKTPGTYRVIARRVPIGTPTLTTCMRASFIASST